MADDRIPTAAESKTNQRWHLRYSELVEHLAATGAMPRETGPAGTISSDEASLASWVRYQRRRFKRQLMLESEEACLEAIPQFVWDPGNESWFSHREALAFFLDHEHRVPRARSVDLAEAALGAWVHKQRHLHRREALARDRVDSLARLPFRIL
jgi:hypothetical protein